MSQIENNSEQDNSVSWSIDRTPDYRSLLHFNIPTGRIAPEPLYHLTTMDYDAMNNSPRLADLIHRYQAHIERHNFDFDFGVASDYLADYNNCIEVIVGEFQVLDKTCCICMSEKDNEQMCSLNCNHTFCIECINTHLSTKLNCPICRTNINKILVQNNEARDKFATVFVLN
jgi:hypothetical protein